MSTQAIDTNLNKNLVISVMKQNVKSTSSVATGINLGDVDNKFYTIHATGLANGVQWISGTGLNAYTQIIPLEDKQLGSFHNARDGQGENKVTPYYDDPANGLGKDIHGQILYLGGPVNEESNNIIAPPVLSTTGLDLTSFPGANPSGNYVYRLGSRNFNESFGV